MLVNPVPGVDRQAVLEALEYVSSRLTQFGTGTHAEVYRDYQKWANESVQYLRNRVSRADVGRLILTQRYWALQAVSLQDGPSVMLWLNIEREERRIDLDEAKQELRLEIARWDKAPMWLIVPDTGIFLHHRERFEAVDWAGIVGARGESIRLVVPLIILDELDNRKRQGGFAGYRAGYSLSKIDNLFKGSDPVRSTPSVRASEWSEEDVKREGGPRGEVTLELVFEAPEHSRLPKADDEIIDRTRTVETLASRTVHLLTFDTTMCFRARAAGLTVHKLEDGDLAEEVKPKPYTPKQQSRERGPKPATA